MKVLLCAALGLIAQVYAQGTRPNTLSNLRLWIKADSLDGGADRYTDGAVIDSAYNWGSVGGAFINAAGTDRPLYQTAVSPTGLPAMEFDGTDDNLVKNSSTAQFNFLHNGTQNTFILAFQLKAAGVAHVFFANNYTTAPTSTQTGTDFAITSSNTAQHFMTRSFAGQATYNNVTSNTFASTTIIQYMAVTITNAGNDTSFIRMNSVSQTRQVQQFAYAATDATQNASIGMASGGLNAYLFEMIIYEGIKSEAEIAGVIDYLQFRLEENITSSITRTGRRRMIN